MKRILLYSFVLLLCSPGFLKAQQVTYSTPGHNRIYQHSLVIGKSQNYYWIENIRTPGNRGLPSAEEFSGIESFELLDSKLNVLDKIPPGEMSGAIKEYLLAERFHLDQLILTTNGTRTYLTCNRYLADENINTQTRLLDSLPFSASPSRILLVRSEDQSKILLLAFENGDDYRTTLHTIMFDSDWNLIYHRSSTKEFFSQPFIQEDFAGFPAESFDNLPLKLGNNGEWFMAYPSRTSHDFFLFHSCANGSEYNYRELPVSSYYHFEDIAMMMDNERQEISLAILSGFGQSSLKNVRITNYSILQGRFIFDSSYRFNAQSSDLRNKNITRESFIAIPGSGYMFLKEYGIPFEFRQPEMPFLNIWDAVYLQPNFTLIYPRKEDFTNGYSMSKGIKSIPFVHNRGDLNLFYFPYSPKDSVWSGILHMEQQTEINNPNLTYLLIPGKDKIYIVYNLSDCWRFPMTTTTVVNRHGEPLTEGLIFWFAKKQLNFQQGRRISSNETAIPYMDNQQKGFAIIRIMETGP